MRSAVTKTRQRYGLVVLGSLSYACLLFVWFSPAAYLSRIVADFGLSSTEAGLLTGAIPLTYVPVALFSGVVTDRIGPARAIGIGLVVFGSAHAGRAVVTTFGGLLSLTVLVGVGGTAITFGLPKLVADLFPTDASGTPSSIYLLGSFAGTAGAFSLGRGLLGPILGGWRPLFLYTGVAVVGFAAVWWAVTLLAPVDALRVRAGDDSESSDASLAGLTRDLRRVVASRPMRWLLLVGAVYLLIVHGLQNWLATILSARGLAPTLAASITSAFVIAEAAGTVAIPPLSDRLGRRGGVIAACGAACTLGIGTFLLPGVPVFVPVAGALVVGVGVGGLSPLVRMVPAEIKGVGPELTGTAVGLVFAVGELGGFLGPFLIGAGYDLTGSYVPGLAFVAAGCAGTVLAGRRLPV